MLQIARSSAVIRPPLQLTGLIYRVDVSCARWPCSRDLNRDAFAFGHCKVIDIGRLGIKGTRRQRAQFRFVELTAVAKIPGARDNDGHPIVGMGMRLDFLIRSKAEQQRLQSSFGGIAFQHDHLNAGNSGRAGRTG